MRSHLVSFLLLLGSIESFAQQNVIVFYTDDQTLNSFNQMPYLQSQPYGNWLIAENAYDEAGLCCPSRAVLLTGQYSRMSGVIDNETGQNLNDSETIAVWLQQAGYRTAWIGTYLNNYPWNRGNSYVPPGWNHWFATDKKYYNYRIYDNGTSYLAGSNSTPAWYHTDYISQHALSFLNAQTSEQPFFMVMSYYGPHGSPPTPPARYLSLAVPEPVFSPNYNEEDVSDKPSWVRALAFSDVTISRDYMMREVRAARAIDDSIEDVVEMLNDKGWLNNTVLIVTTDNGFSIGSHRWQGKVAPYEESIRILLMIRFPSDPQTIDTRLIQNIDIPATILDIANAQPTLSPSGTSLRSTSNWRDAALIVNRSLIHAVPPFWGIVTRDWKYVEYDNEEKELYDLSNDRFELENHADDPLYSEIQLQLHARLQGMINNDTSPIITISDKTVSEPAGTGSVNANFKVTLTPAVTENTSVHYAIESGTAQAGLDFAQTASGALTIPAGSSSGTISVSVLGDGVSEETEYYYVRLSLPTNARLGNSLGTGAISNRRPGLSISDVSINEGQSGSTTAVFSVTPSVVYDIPLSVNFATASGTAIENDDYAGTSGTLNIPANASGGTIDVSILGDTAVEGDETFTVNLSNAINATISDSSGRGTIVTDESPVLSINDVSVVEGNSGTVHASFTVTQSLVSATNSTVKVQTVDGTARRAGDYAFTSVTVTIPAGSTSLQVSIPILGDALYEADETFKVILTNPSGATIADGEGIVIIQNDDAPPMISINDVTVLENDTNQTVSFIIGLSQISGVSTTVTYTTADGTAVQGSDYAKALNKTITIAAGSAGKGVSITVKGDTIAELQESFFINLSNPLNATIGDGQGRCTINDDD